jgi:cytochrome b6-f complex iron-sulfur subunit
MTRKEFVKLCGSSCIAVVGMSLFAEQAMAAMQVNQDEENKLTIEKEKFIKKKKDEEITYKKYIKITPGNSEYPILVYRFDENDYAAVLLKCTHRGTELNVNGDMLTCPAHDSEFSLKGEVLQGPADESLQTFPVTTDELNVYINLA